METIEIKIFQADVYEEVAKATDYTGSKLAEGDEGARDRILITDDDLDELGRMWEESVVEVNENFKEMLVSGETTGTASDIGSDGNLSNRPFPDVPAIPISTETGNPDAPETSEGTENTESPEEPDDEEKPDERVRYEASIEVSVAFDKKLSASVQSALRSYFIASIIGQWFKFANRGDAQDYFVQATAFLKTAERLLYTRREPARPTAQ